MKYIISIYLVFFTIFVSAQVPQRMSYQAVIRNANNTLLSQQLISVRISILQADTAGQPVYVETHYTKTNINGLITLQIGGGLKFFGDFNSINWSTGRYFVKTETDPDGGFDYRITGYSELLSVPYALYAGGQTDTTNLIKKINTKLSITDTTSMLAPYAKKENFITKADLDSTNNFDINLQGNISASKNVTVKGNIEALGSTSTLGTIDKPFKGLYLSSGSLSIASDTLGQNIPAAVLSNVEGNLQITGGGVKLMGNNTSFIASRIVGALTGNATTATKLQTARTINNVPFDGSANITIATTSPNSLTYTNTGTGDVPGGAYDGSLAKTISYNSIGASPLAGSSLITIVGTLASGSIPFTLLTGTIPIWNQSTTGNAATATYATSAGSLSGTIPTWNQSTTGNAATATKLATTKNINGVAFDGSADISITAIADAGTLSGTTLNSTITGSSITSVGTLANLTVTNPITGSVTGNAATATYATSAGSLSGTTLNSTITGSSLTSVGTLANLTVTNPITGSVTGNATTATYATSAGSLSGTIPTWNQSTTGNAATATYATSAGTASKATILETARNINGVSFDGSADISITAIADAGTLSGTTLNGTILNSSLTSVGTLASLTVANPITGSVTGNAATATYATSAGSLSGTIPTWNQSTTGNAATATYATSAGTASKATILETARNINGVSFNGSADISITAISDAGTLSGTTLNSTITGSSLTSVGTLANLTVTNPITGSVTGNAATATYATSAGTASKATILETARNINGVSFDGSADISITAIADAGTLSGTTLNGTILNSSLTSVGTLANLTVTNPISGSVTGNATTATYATSAGSLSGTIPTWNQSTTGNAATATKLATTKNINGVAFDGSADISITAIADAGTLSGTTLNGTILNSSLTSVGTLANLTVTNPITGSVTGNAATATYATSAGFLSGTIPTWNQSTTGNAATATYATSAGSLSGTIPTWNQSTTGNAATATYATSAGTASKATILETARNINGVSFDGSTDITISTTAPNSLTYNNSGIGDVSGGTYDGSLAKTISYNSVGASPLAGSASITTLGTIATGTWSATTIGISKGGTNSTATPTAGAIVYGNGSSYAISAVGTSGQYLQSTGTGAPTWSQPGPASIQVLTTSGTYTTPAGVKAIIIELIGGGGGSGAIVAPSNNQSTVSGGGGSGAYTKAIILNPTTTYTFTIGAAGTASVAGTAGGAGGQTSFDGTNITAPGGLGGGAGSATGTGTVSQGGAGGAAGVGGIFMITGNSGGSGFGTSAIAVSGAGANSYIGAGGTSRATATATLAGANGIGYGGGASGAASSITTAASGAAGFHGVIIVTEFK